MKEDSQHVEVCLCPLRKIQTPIGSSKVLNHQILLQRLVNSTGTSASSYTPEQTLRKARRQLTHLLGYENTLSLFITGTFMKYSESAFQKSTITNYHAALWSINFSFSLYFFPLPLSLNPYVQPFKQMAFIAIKELHTFPCCSHE